MLIFGFVNIYILVLISAILSGCGAENCGSSNVNSDFAMSALYYTECPMPNIETTGLDPVVTLANNFYYDGWYLKHKVHQAFGNGLRCTQENYYKNSGYNIDMPHYTYPHVLYHERASNGTFTLEITLQSPPAYCGCIDGASDYLIAEYTDIEIEDLYAYYSATGAIPIGFNDDFAWFELAYGKCYETQFKNEIPH